MQKDLASSSSAFELNLSQESIVGSCYASSLSNLAIRWLSVGMENSPRLGGAAAL
jgi:hypothetical protein